MSGRLLAVLVLATCAACGDGSDGTPASAPPTSEVVVRPSSPAVPAPSPTATTLPVTTGVPVTDVLAQNLTGQVTLAGYLVIEAGSARLCELLLEVEPPACGGVSVSVTGPVDAPALLDSGTGVRWSPFPVDLAGSKLVADGPPPQLTPA